LGSTTLLNGLAQAPIIVVADTTEANMPLERRAKAVARLARDPCGLSKRGVVSVGVGKAYEAFKERLLNEAHTRGLGERLELHALRDHGGFAMAVRRGLEESLALGRRFALVVQHDRAFIRRYAAADLAAVLGFFDEVPSCRYVGFPTSTSKKLVGLCEQQYQLRSLVRARSRLVRHGLTLRPCVFWYDSNHLVDAARALQLYSPFKHAPAELHAHLGPSRLKRLVLRKGDFIEDRLGVEMRDTLVGLAGDEGRLLRMFDWFGCYVLEERLEEGPDREPLSDKSGADAAGAGCDEAGGGLGRYVRERHPGFVDRLGRVSAVAHLDARGARPRSWLSLLPRLGDGDMGGRQERSTCGESRGAEAEACTQSDLTLACGGTADALRVRKG